MQTEVNTAFDIIREAQQTPPPVDVDLIAAKLGLKVDYLALTDHLAGSISRWGTDYEIKVNATHHRNRQRFTLAHEIAHFVLHRDMIGNGIQDSKLYRSHLSNYHETQANRLAAEILMPKTQVEMIFMHSNKSVERCASMFEVSVSAMSIRLRGLGLISQQPIGA